MKNTCKLLTFSLIAFLIVSCSQGEGPEVVAKDFIDAISAEDFDKAKEFATDESKEYIDFFKLANGMKGKNKEDAEKLVVKDLKCKIEGDTSAVCTFLRGEKEEGLHLKKTSGKWLVSMQKEIPTASEAEKEKAISDSIATSKLLDSINQTK
jgi:hypothetical protein